MGMDSQKLSKRRKQPGHDQTFRAAEVNFYDALVALLPAKEFLIADKPRDLLQLLGGSYGIQPEASIEYLRTRKKMYFEVKKQAARGNAEERACKHHTVQFYRTLREFTGYDYHAFSTIMCDELATLPRYVSKHPFYFEKDQYFLWVKYDRELLSGYLDRIVRRFLTR